MNTHPNTKEGAISSYTDVGQPPLPLSGDHYRYRISEQLALLPVGLYRQAMRELPALLGITPNTWTNWRKLLLEDTADIPALKLQQIAHYLNTGVEDLLTPAAILQLRAMPTLRVTWEKGGAA